MSLDSNNPYAVAGAGYENPAMFAGENERVKFIQRTYTHLTGAVLALIAVEAFLFTVVPQQFLDTTVRTMMSGYGWLVVLGVFMGVSWMARSWASSDAGPAKQYLGLGLYVLAQAVVLLPLLYVCTRLLNQPELPLIAAAITSITFMALTAFIFVTKTDLSGMGKYLAIGGFVAMGLIVVSIVAGFSLGLWFSGLMVALACGYIAYDTSNIMHHYRTDQHVAASLALFASVVLLFWYVLQLLMAFSSND